MRHLIYFLLFSTVAFSQNYNYGIDEKSTIQALPLVNNQLEEIEYFKAYVLPLSQKYNLQKALDTYGAVRLEKGDYRGVNITMRSNQRLYGHSIINPISLIKIAQGSTNVHIESLNINATGIEFEAGLPITNCTIKTVRYGTINAIGAKLENNLFVNILSKINFDFSAIGYYRNNKFIKQQSSTTSPLVSIKGNSTTPSYGNVHFWTNLLTPHGDGMVLDNLGNTTFLGVDAEGWNLESESVDGKAVIYARNMSNLKLTGITGSNTYSPEPKTAGFDIQATKLTLLNSALNSTVTSLLSPNTNFVNLSPRNTYTRSAGTITGYDIAMQNYIEPVNTKDVSYNGVLQSATITDPTTTSNFTNAFLETQHTPWARPTWETLPDPLGANWKTERIGKPDSRAYIQNLIDTNGIAELPEGVFYIGSTLYIGEEDMGIIGKGTGKTVICGLTDDFPLLTMDFPNTSPKYHLSYLTLQGGSKGQFFPENSRATTYINSNFVVFRDQAIGIHHYKMSGFDNNFLNNICFVNCGVGVMQEPKSGDTTTLGYIDKTIYYKNQYINCGIGSSMMALRSNNLNAWVDCKYDGNGVAYRGQNDNSSMIINSDFTNNTGDYLVNIAGLTMFNCNFYNNSPTIATFKYTRLYLEGCNFDDTSVFAHSSSSSDTALLVYNSTIDGDALTKNKSSIKEDDTLFINTILTSHPALSRFMTKVSKGISTVIINSKPTPYPQLLVTQ